MTSLTRDLVETACDAIGIEAARRGIVAEIAVYGGSCIMLASDIRNAKGDVDVAIRRPGQRPPSASSIGRCSWARSARRAFC